MTTEGSGQVSESMSRVLQLAIDDIEFRQRLIESPEEALAERNLTLPPNEMEAVVGSSREEREQLLLPLENRANPGFPTIHVWSLRIALV